MIKSKCAPGGADFAERSKYPKYVSPNRPRLVDSNEHCPCPSNVSVRLNIMIFEGTSSKNIGSDLRSYRKHPPIRLLKYAAIGITCAPQSQRVPRDESVPRDTFATCPRNTCTSCIPCEGKNSLPGHRSYTYGFQKSFPRTRNLQW